MISKDPSKVARCKGVTPWKAASESGTRPRAPGPMPRMIHPQIDEPVANSHQICGAAMAFWLKSLPKSLPEFPKNT